MPRKLPHFAKLARENLTRRFGSAGLATLAPAVVERLLLAEAADLVMAQVMDKYAPAQALISEAAHTPED